jgi:hypothetical protein
MKQFTLTMSLRKTTGWKGSGMQAAAVWSVFQFVYSMRFSRMELVGAEMELS